MTLWVCDKCKSHFDKSKVQFYVGKFNGCKNMNEDYSKQCSCYDPAHGPDTRCLSFDEREDINNKRFLGKWSKKDNDALIKRLLDSYDKEM